MLVRCLGFGIDNLVTWDPKVTSGSSHLVDVFVFVLSYGICATKGGTSLVFVLSPKRAGLN
jgi:hypothetical protein